MCEINPAHTLIMRLECFTSDSRMTSEQFTAEVMDRLLAAEMSLNADGKFRFHIHEEEPAPIRRMKNALLSALELDHADCVCGDPYDKHRARHDDAPGDCLVDGCMCEEWSPKEDEGLEVPEVVMVPR